MKTQDFQKPLLVIAAVSVLYFLAGNAVAQDSTASTAAPSASVQTAPQLSYGVSQIVQLAQAKVGDSTIIAYIQNSGNSYGLNANQIIYLRQQGVSDGVINVMLNQRNNPAVAAAQTATTSPQQNSSDAGAQTSTAVAQPTVTYVQTVPSIKCLCDSRHPDIQLRRLLLSAVLLSVLRMALSGGVVLFGFGNRWGGGWHGGGFHGGGHGGWHH